MWQDIAISIANIAFSVSLFPQVYHGFKVKTGPIKYQTSIPTFVGLFVVAYAMMTLSLYFAATITFITAIMWFLLFWQSVVYKK